MWGTTMATSARRRSIYFVLFATLQLFCNALTRGSSVFHGRRLSDVSTSTSSSRCSTSFSQRCNLTMRKQKASDRRTRRRQRGMMEQEEQLAVKKILSSTITSSPMQSMGSWKTKSSTVATMEAVDPAAVIDSMTAAAGTKTGGRGRSRKRSNLYKSLAFYHNHFLALLTQEYKAEEDEVLGRIHASLDDPLGLEYAGFALFDLYPQRRGNLFSDEVYRLTKATDATTVYSRSINDDDDDDQKKIGVSLSADPIRYIPPNHKFSLNDVIMLTLQPNGSGDFFGPATLPTNENAMSVEARVLNHGPTYVDVALPAGSFEAGFAQPAPNDSSGAGDKRIRLRMDRFISNVPYQRMVAALAQITSIPDRQKRSSTPEEVAAAPTPAGPNQKKDKTDNTHDGIKMDEVIREAILSTYSVSGVDSSVLQELDMGELQELSIKLSKPPMASSYKLAAQVLKFFKANPKYFPKYNAPQRSAIEASLTRRMTMIQGPPGSGKTAVAAAVAFGFVHQCRSLSPHTKVLACAFSNVGADNMAEAIIKLGVKVVRVGKPSAITEALWNITLDAAIDRDPAAQKALKNAARATAQLSKLSRRDGKSSSSSTLSERTIRDAATYAVKASIEACNIAATKALREADVIVATSSGAADARLLTACGVVKGDTDDEKAAFEVVKFTTKDSFTRNNAPDGLPPLSLPFVIIDEACQSVEPASLIPIVSSNSCRSLVMLGDPCQLPPTIRSGQDSSLSMSLMERLSATLPHPSVTSQVDNTIGDGTFLNSLAIKQAKSLLRSMEREQTPRSYRKRFAGSLLLSVQYRMHPSISAFPSAVFYDGQLSTPMSMARERSFPSALQKLMPCGNPDLCVRAINVGGRCNERQGNPNRFSRTVFTSRPSASLLEEQTTYWNEPEAISVISLMKDMLRGSASEPINSIGVISPYNGQVQLIKSMIASDGELRDLLMKLPTTIEVKSVDGYQGRERDVIIFSAVRSNRQGRIGFLHDWRRMNVALTRAKSALLVVLDLETLSEADKHWAAFGKWASSARCVVDDFDSPQDEPSP